MKNTKSVSLTRAAWTQWNHDGMRTASLLVDGAKVGFVIETRRRVGCRGARSYDVSCDGINLDGQGRIEIPISAGTPRAIKHVERLLNEALVAEAKIEHATDKARAILAAWEA